MVVHMNTILIVDNDKAIRMLYAEELKEDGYEVITTGDDSRVTALIEQTRPDLVVMEVLLGNHNGLEILQDITDTHKDLPVILCTARPAFRADPRSRAAAAYIVKGSNINELKGAIKAVLDEVRQYCSAGRHETGYSHKPVSVDKVR